MIYELLILVVSLKGAEIGISDWPMGEGAWEIFKNSQKFNFLMPSNISHGMGCFGTDLEMLFNLYEYLRVHTKSLRKGKKKQLKMAVNLFRWRGPPYTKTCARSHKNLVRSDTHGIHVWRALCTKMRASIFGERKWNCYQASITSSTMFWNRYCHKFRKIICNIIY